MKEIGLGFRNDIQLIPPC